MTPERWRQVTEIFHAAIATEPAQRDAFLAEACAHDRGLRADVESLIAAHRQADGFGDRPVSVTAPSLESGTSFGPYRIEGLLGAGGMGEVYRARDVKLGRDVAIKILPPHFTSDLERLARFEREARVLAALNHPRIGAIYGVEEAGGMMGLVLELVEGPTLADRLARGRLSNDEALRIAVQIAEALEAAHAHGIVHRDLKPANIGITQDGAVKVLDFGLAKVAAGDAPAAAQGASPTVTVTTAREGLIMGSPAYVSPEQARGKPVDKRCDIWAFGCVVYEMLAGHAAFEAETVSDTIAGILEREPAWETLPADLPPTIRRLLKRCLKKDPSERLHDIADARLEIADAVSAPPAVDRPATGANQGHRRLLMAAALVALTVAMLSLAFGYRGHPSQSAALIEFPINLPTNAGNAGYGLAVSPDGRRVAYAACCIGPQIWMHSLESDETRPIPGTDYGAAPFWSPDNSEIGFFANDKLMRVDLAGGPPALITDLPGPGSLFDWGASWNTDGVILFSAHGGLFRVSASGGTPSRVEVVDDAGDGVRGQPQFLPDNRHFFYHASGRRREGIYLASLDSARATYLVESDRGAIYAPPSYLVYQRVTALMAQRFNLDTYTLEGQAIRVASDAAPNYICQCRNLFASASANGVLALVRTTGGSVGRLTWFDRQGKVSSSVEQLEGSEFLNPAVSPDGEQVAVNRMDPQTGNWDIWIVDVARGTASRLTSDPARDSDPVWSPDGKEIVFASNRGGQFGLYKTVVGGSGADERLLGLAPDVVDAAVTEWSPDPSLLLYQVLTESHPWWTEWALPLSGDRKPVPILQSETREGRKYAGHLSPDGHWSAYVSFETGTPEIYIERFMAHTGKIQISHGGGTHPRWTRGGRELVYWSAPGQGGVASVDIDLTPSGVRAGMPRPLISTPILNMIDGRPHYDVTRDGQRFLLRQPVGSGPPTITVIFNWPDKLKRSAG
jgi:serine/threonine protein kinase/Tol biopolymer transport system component